MKQTDSFIARHTSVIFLSAFLLFQVQPMIGKYILPWFGGGPAVWTTCMLFFQVLLLGGYAYSHFLTGSFSPRRQVVIHLILLVASLAALPITPSESWRPVGAEMPALRILGLLATSVGVPFLFISSTSSLIQRWFSWERPGVPPYRLYALSNVGSLVGLISYPFVVEPLIGVRAQMVLWSSGYALFVLVSIGCAVGLYRSQATVNWQLDQSREAASKHKTAGPNLLDLFIWIALPACGSLLLLATTNQITQDIAPIPFLWIVPLVLYLVSFIVTFDHERWYRRRIWGPALIACLLAVSAVLFGGATVNIFTQVLVYSITLFSSCMVCHGELVRRKPDPRHLTLFYLFVSVGGALGGILVNIVAPQVFDSYLEFQGGLLAAYVLFALCFLFDKKIVWRKTDRLKLGAGFVAGGLLLTALFGTQVYQSRLGTIAIARNFYGSLSVIERGVGTPNWARFMRHGRILHGGQFMDEARRSQTTTYYGPSSGAALAIKHYPRPKDRGIHIGLVGMGVGTIAAYGQPGDTLRSYEINPEVVRMAGEYFYYRKDTRAQEEVVLGDARNTLKHELDSGHPQRFDILVLDAFSGDSVPIHLLTREAFRLYLSHLKPDGVLAINVSSYHLKLNRVVYGLAADAGKQAVRIINETDADQRVTWSEWILITDNAEFLQNTEIRAASQPEPDRKIIWTDDYSNLLHVVQIAAPDDYVF